MLYFSRTFILKYGFYVKLFKGEMLLKRVTALFILICLALITMSCGNNQPSSLMAGQTDERPAETGSETTPETPPEATENGEYGSNAIVSVINSVAYLFDEGNVLYGAIEYRNDGNCPLVLTGAKFVFTSGAYSLEKGFTPMLCQYDVLYPGDTSYVTYWGAPDEDAQFRSDIDLTASLECEKAAADRIDLEVSELLIADNYPGFSTLSGTVENKSGTDCNLNLIYAAFYDGSGSLMGVWHFSENATLKSGVAHSFVVDMTELAIDGLSSRASAIKASGFGFN